MGAAAAGGGDPGQAPAELVAVLSRSGNHRRDALRPWLERSDAIAYARAKALGQQLVDAERSLDELFESKTVNADSLSETLASIGAIRAELRGAHLQAHLEQTRILSSDQIAEYQRLRGYATAQTHSGQAHGHRHKHQH